MAPKKRSFELKEKLKIIKYANDTTVSAAAKAFGIDRKQVIEWRKKEAVLRSVTTADKKANGRKRLGGGGRRRLIPELDDILFDWILSQRMKSLRVSRRSIREEAKRIYPTLASSANVIFKASVGWLDRFLKRHSLSLRRRTTVAQKDPDQLCSRISSLVSFISHTVKSKKVQPGSIVAMDETSLWFDMLSNTTIAPTGSKTIQLKSTGNEKAHATVILAAKGDGTKLKPYVVFKKSVREVARLQATNGIVVKSSSNGWMNDELTTDWLQKVYGTFDFKHRILAWDSYRCHISESTKKELSKYNTTMVVIPGGCTKFIQAADVCWNKPFKAHITELYDSWLAGDSNKQYTKGGGNLKAPSKALMLDWVKQAWEALPTELITKSFKCCALTIATDGTEDEKIHCLKPGNQCAPALDLLNMARLTEHMESVQVLDEDAEEDENNEIVIDSEDDLELIDIDETDIE